MVHRKPGSNILQTRKPFVDRTINCNTPDVNKKHKSNIPVKENIKTSSPCAKTENLEVNPEDYFSYKDVDDQFEDLLPYSKRLEEHHVFSILERYLNNNTPPPSPTILDIPCEMDEVDHSYDSSFKSHDSYDDDMLMLPKSDVFGFEHVGDVDLPVSDIDTL